MTTLPASIAPVQLNVRAPSDRALMAMLVALITFSAALGRFCFLLRPFDNDAAIFIYMGKMVSTGGRLCHDLIDNKFPTVGLMTSIIYKAFGTCWPAYVTFQAVISLATALSLGRTAARVAGAHARLPTVLFALVFLNFTTAVFGGFQLETLQIFFTVLAAGAGIEMMLTGNPADGFVAGLCAGCGAMFKPTAVGVLVALFVGMIAARFIAKNKYEREGAKARRKTRRDEKAEETKNGSSSLLRVFLQGYRAISCFPAKIFHRREEKPQRRQPRMGTNKQELELIPLIRDDSCHSWPPPFLLCASASLRFKFFLGCGGAALSAFAPSRSHLSRVGSAHRWAKPTLLLSVIAGLSIPLAFAAIYLINADLLRDMPALCRQISTYAHESVFDTVELIKPLTALALLGFPMLIRGCVFRRQTNSEMKWQPSPVTIVLIAWLAIETAGVILQRRMYAYHFLPMVPPAALLFGMLPRLNRPAALAASLLPIAFLSILQAANFISTTKPGEDRLPVSDYLIAHAKPGDAVWMDAWPRVILETGLRPGSRLPFTFLFTNYDTAGLDYSAGIIADFDRIKPAFIILPTPLDRRMQYQIDFIPELNRRPIRRESYVAGWHRIEQYTLEHYEKEAMVGNDAVYHRRGD